MDTLPHTDRERCRNRFADVLETSGGCAELVWCDNGVEPWRPASLFVPMAAVTADATLNSRSIFGYRLPLTSSGVAMPWFGGRVGTGGRPSYRGSGTKTNRHTQSTAELTTDHTPTPPLPHNLEFLHHRDYMPLYSVDILSFVFCRKTFHSME